MCLRNVNNGQLISTFFGLRPLDLVGEEEQQESGKRDTADHSSK